MLNQNLPSRRCRCQLPGRWPLTDVCNLRNLVMCEYGNAPKCRCPDWLLIRFIGMEPWLGGTVWRPYLWASVFSSIYRSATFPRLTSLSSAFLKSKSHERHHSFDKANLFPLSASRRKISKQFANQTALACWLAGWLAAAASSAPKYWTFGEGDSSAVSTIRHETFRISIIL